MSMEPVLNSFNEQGNEPCYEDKIFKQLACSAAFYKCAKPGRQTELIMSCRKSCEEILKACGDRYDLSSYFSQ